MEILVAVIALAGAILSAIAAAALIQRLRDEPEGWLVAWTVAVAGLCLSLAVIALGSFMGFGSVTFRIYQVTGSMLAPLWLAVGLVQLLAEKVPPRFLAWLLGIALTVVATVIMVWDPLKTDDMGKSLPTAAAHWNIVPGYLLTGVHAVAVLIMLAMLVVAGLRWRNGDEYDTDNLHATVVIVPSGLALVGAMRFSVPALFTTALLAVAGGRRSGTPCCGRWRRTRTTTRTTSTTTTTATSGRRAATSGPSAARSSPRAAPIARWPERTVPTSARCSATRCRGTTACRSRCRPPTCRRSRRAGRRGSATWWPSIVRATARSTTPPAWRRRRPTTAPPPATS
ncbi:hypothetical protein [Nonomuraea salmonea]|uniref:hypothetical protein n=1 Tax=Nonomuraea salmonea TaxID=46181 RepID=UPI0031F05395